MLISGQAKAVCDESSFKDVDAKPEPVISTWVKGQGNIEAELEAVPYVGYQLTGWNDECGTSKWTTSLKDALSTDGKQRPLKVSTGEGARAWITLRVVASPGWKFLQWKGELPADAKADAEPLKFEVNEDRRILAVLTRTEGSSTSQEVQSTAALPWLKETSPSKEDSTKSKAAEQARNDFASLDLVGDLSRFLVDMGVYQYPHETKDLAFDTGAIEYGEEGLAALRPNGIPDIAELKLLQTMLQTPSFNTLPSGGMSCSLFRKYFRSNYLRACQDLGKRPEYWRRITAAYMTLGTDGHREVVPRYLELVKGEKLESVEYELSAGSHFWPEHGDVDADGCLNVEEWRSAIAITTHGGPVTMAAVELYGHNACDAKTSCRAVEKPVDVATPEGQQLLAEATGQNESYAEKAIVTFVGRDKKRPSDLPIEVHVVEPPGFENLPLPLNTPMEIITGTSIRVTVMDIGDSRKLFRIWSAPNTLIDGSNQVSTTFTVTGSVTVVAL